MDNYQLIVDDRETAIINIFKDYDYIVKRLSVGDYALTYNDKILFIIERKTWKDLSASIKDGRKNNVEKMLETREQTGCKLLYLIEGSPFNKPTTKICGIQFKNLQAHLDHLIFRDNIHIVYSKNKENTIEKLKELVKNYSTIQPPLINTEQIKNNELLTKKYIPSDLCIIYKIWRCIPNITDKTTSLFLENKYHISDILSKNIT